MKFLLVPRSDDHGQSLVEFALAVPILLLLVVGIIDIGRGLQAYTALGEAIRDASREAAVHGQGATVQWGPAANDTRITSAVRSRAVGLVPESVAVTSSWPAGNNATGSEVVVSASYTFRPAAAALLGNLSLQLSNTTRARIYR